MSSARKPFAKADIPDIHSESVEELREAFDLFDTKGAGALTWTLQAAEVEDLHDDQPKYIQDRTGQDTKYGNAYA